MTVQEGEIVDSKPKTPDVQVRTTGEFKLRKSPPNRALQFIHLEKMFGFVPEVIVVELGSGNNKFKVSAIIPEKVLESMKKEEAEVKAKLAKSETPEVKQ